MVFYFGFAPLFSFLTNEIPVRTMNIITGKKKTIQKYYVVRMLAKNMNVLS